MASEDDRNLLVRATELLQNVIEHRGEDLRVLTLLNSAVQDIRTGEKYLRSTERQPVA